MKLAAIAAGISVLGVAEIASAQDNRSLTNSGLQAPQEASEPRVITSGGGARADAGGDDEDAPLAERVVLLKNTIKQLTLSLANANAEAETYKRQA
ncbi:MAG: hypothetical protein PHR16_18205, partial [Methylovulum sp.]|nr:hypothetical protein [Methylovulum sp.]